MRSCTLIYRTYAGENGAPRPHWYSKRLCLFSFLRAVEQARQHYHVTLVVLHDGPLSANPDWSTILQNRIPPFGHIVEQERTNNAISCLAAIRRGCAADDDEIVLLAEDDYLWQESALVGMFAALTELPAQYVTGYDHPDRYRFHGFQPVDLPHWDSTIYLAGDRHWRTQESTCMTFASTSAVLKEDLWLFERYHNNGWNAPDDCNLFRHLQGLGHFANGGNRRRLMGPIPSLTTHVHIPFLAPMVDWEHIALRTSML